jgi:lysine 2,3-aminomutase
VDKLARFLNAVLPDTIPYDKSGIVSQTRDELVRDVVEGTEEATMAIRMT